MQFVQLIWDNPSDRFSSYLALVILGLIAVFPVVTGILLFAMSSHLNKDSVIKTIGTLYSGLRYDTSKASLLYPVIFVLRRLIFVTVAVRCHDTPIIQVLSTLLSSFGILVYLFHVKPLISNNLLEIYNELTITLCSYHLIIFTEVAQGFFDKKYLAGFSIITIVGLNLLINISIMLVNTVRRLL